jgi:hypothetical protein
MLSILNSSSTGWVAGVVGILRCTRPEAVVPVPVEVAVREAIRHCLNLLNVLVQENSAVQVFVRKAVGKGLDLLLVQTVLAGVGEEGRLGFGWPTSGGVVFLQQQRGKADGRLRRIGKRELTPQTNLGRLIVQK